MSLFCSPGAGSRTHVAGRLRAKRAGEKVDKGVDDADRALEKAREKAADKLEETGKKIRDVFLSTTEGLYRKGDARHHLGEGELGRIIVGIDGDLRRFHFSILFPDK
jgi:hypothetical protein